MDCDCSSDACYQIPILGGTCGECLSDADCPGGGCTLPDPLFVPAVGAVCNDGSLADGCQSDAACQAPLICVDVLEIPGIITSTTCSECETDPDCGGDLCAPEYAFPSLGGYWECVLPGSKPDGTGCALVGSGDESCASGRCAEADVMGLFSVGVCSPCEIDADCHEGDVCDPAYVTTENGLVPAQCVTP